MTPALSPGSLSRKRERERREEARRTFLYSFKRKTLQARRMRQKAKATKFGLFAVSAARAVVKQGFKLIFIDRR
jgi:hypothetical protein